MEHKIPGPQSIAWRGNNLVSDRVGRQSKRHSYYIIANRRSAQSCPSISRMNRKSHKLCRLTAKERQEGSGGRGGGREKMSTKKKVWLKQEKEIPYNYFILYSNK